MNLWMYVLILWWVRNDLEFENKICLMDWNNLSCDNFNVVIGNGVRYVV